MQSNMEVPIIPIDGGRNPIKIGETTATIGQLVADVLEALKTNAGSKLLKAISENWNTLKLVNNVSGFRRVYNIAAYRDNIIYFSHTFMSGTYNVDWTVCIYLESNSHNIYTQNIHGTTISQVPITTIDSNTAGTWELYI